jgi:predicted enzyme involved in methoxymalonyl-ACP biosynthesis
VTSNGGGGAARCGRPPAREGFGDHGRIGLLAVRADGDRLDVLIWLMSCRALGRGVEERLPGRLADRADQLDCTRCG